MKNIALFFTIGLSLLACSTSDYEERRNFFIGTEDEHIGEYLQKKSANKIVTVVRRSLREDRMGILEINLQDGTWVNMNPNFPQARDLKLVDGVLAFRNENQIFIQEGNEFFTPTIEPFKKLDALIVDQPERFVAGLLETGESLMVCIENNEITAKRILPGRLLAVLSNSVGERIGLFSDSKDISVASFRSCREGFDKARVVVAGSHSKYISGTWNSDRIFFAFLDEELGTLNYALGRSLSDNFETSLISGEAFQSYVGMDIALFETEKERPSMAYMDGEVLELRISRFYNGGWVHFDPGFAGDSGFYTQILSFQENALDLIFHAFRSVQDSGEISFEDLQRRQIKLPPLSPSGTGKWRHHRFAKHFLGPKYSSAFQNWGSQ